MIRSSQIIRVLWFVAAALGLVILTIRTHGVLSSGELTANGTRPDARAAFNTPVTAAVGSFSVDALSSGDQPPLSINPKQPATITIGTDVTVVGWAFDATANAPFAAIGAQVDRRPEIYSAIMKVPRPDVATALAQPNALDTGFVLTVLTATLPAGRHVIAIRALQHDGRAAKQIGVPIAFDLRAQSADQSTDSFDAINGVVVNAAVPGSQPITILRSFRRLTVYGWAFVTSGKRLASSVALLVDGNPAVSATYGVPRADVATAFHDIRLTKCGFIASLATDQLPSGIHEIRVRLISSDGSTVDSYNSIRVNLQ